MIFVWRSLTRERRLRPSASSSSVDRFVIEHLCDTLSIDQKDNAFLPQREGQVPPLRRGDIGVPDDALVVMTAGLPSKFSPGIAALGDYFQMIREVMGAHDQVHWVVAGMTEEQLRLVWKNVPSTLENRIHALGVTDGIDHVLPVADVYLDTFPVSGGLCVFQAMRKRVASITYRFWWNGLLDVAREYSMVGDFLDGTEVVVPEATVAAQKERLLRLLANQTYRMRIADLGAKLIEAQADDRRFARACEQRYLELVRRRGSPVADA